MRTKLALVCTMACTVIAAQEQQSDLDRMQGKWQAVSIVEDGKKVSQEDVAKSWMDIKGNRFVFHGEESFLGRLELNSRMKPRWITATFLDKEGKEQGVAHGIYEFSGEQLKIAWRHKSEERPKNFDSAAASGIRSVVLKRSGQ